MIGNAVLVMRNATGQVEEKSAVGVTARARKGGDKERPGTGTHADARTTVN